MNPYTRKVAEASSESDENDEEQPPPTVSQHASSKPAAALVIAASDKAGMDGIDRARIDEIILRESGNSLFMQQQRKRDEKVNKNIHSLRQKLQQQELNNPHWRIPLQAAVDKEIPFILAKRPVRSACVVVDMDMFYMACELLSRPDLQDKPAVVGGGMILTSNYKARQYGVRSAMAGWIGDKLVEELSGGKEKLVHVKSNFELYRQKSLEVRKVLAEYDPHLRAYSLDEAYMDLGPYLALKLTKGWTHEEIQSALLSEPATDEHDTATEDDTTTTWTKSQEVLGEYSTSICQEVAARILSEMRQRVTEATGGLTCSAGLAPNFLLAKIASDRNKPNGQLIVGSDHESVTDFLYPLAIRKVSGIGRVTEKILHAFGITTVRELYEQRALVRFLFKPTSANNLLKASLGCSSSDGKVSEEESAHGQKGISRERTFQAKNSWAEINSKLEDIGRLLSSDMRRKDLWAHTITVKVKLHTFDCLSRSRSMGNGVYVQAPDELVSIATELLREIRKDFEGKHFSVRLLGIRCSNFQDPNERADTHQTKINFPKAEAKSPPASGSPVAPKKSHSPKVVPKKANSFASPLSHPISDDSAAITNKDNADNEDADEQIVLVRCPVCDKEFPEDENDALNRHIDACLNGSVVRKAVREASAASVPAAKRQRLTDFYRFQPT